MNFEAIFLISAEAIDEFFENLDMCVGFDLKVQNQRSNMLKITYKNFLPPGSLWATTLPARR